MPTIINIDRGRNTGDIYITLQVGDRTIKNISFRTDCDAYNFIKSLFGGPRGYRYSIAERSRELRDILSKACEETA